jgi:putative hydrolase of the HAD superfamily
LNIPHLQFYSIWNEIFEPMDGIEEVLERLYPRYPLFLVSNTNEVHFHYISIRYSHLMGYFQDFILSFLAKSRKPEPGIYQTLIKATGRPAHQILFIDDKLPFVEAARGQGLAAWQFTDLEDLRRKLTESGLW